MAEALPEGGRLVTCDIDEHVVAIAQSFFDRSPHGKKIEVKLGPAADTLRSFPETEVFDLVFLDADKSAYLEYYELSLPHLRKGGLLVADNTLWSGAVLNPTTEDAKAIHAFNQRVTSDPRVDNVLLSIRDGIMVTRKL
jgi:caffeoyl-CoA O-methyltransferase